MTTHNRRIDRRTKTAILVVCAIAAPLLIHAAHDSERPPYDGRLGVHELQNLRAAVMATMPNTGLPVPQDAVWFGMDLRHEPVGRITMRIPSYREGNDDTTVAHGDTVAPGFLPRPPKERPQDAGSYMLEPIGSWDTVYYVPRQAEPRTPSDGPVLMMNGVGVGRARADAMVREAAADIGRRFHLGPAKFTRDASGSISAVYRFSAKPGADTIGSDIVSLIAMKADAVHGNAFMAVRLL